MVEELLPLFGLVAAALVLYNLVSLGTIAYLASRHPELAGERGLPLHPLDLSPDKALRLLKFLAYGTMPAHDPVLKIIRALWWIAALLALVCFVYFAFVFAAGFALRPQETA